MGTQIRRDREFGCEATPQQPPFGMAGFTCGSFTSDFTPKERHSIIIVFTRPHYQRAKTDLSLRWLPYCIERWDKGNTLAKDMTDQDYVVRKRERFDIRRDPDNTWTVYDIFSGLVVTVSGILMTSLSVDVAFYVVDELNDQDFKRRIGLDF